MSLNEKNYPYTAELMQKHMFEQAADGLGEAITQYRQNGHEYVQSVLGELESLLTGPWSEAQLTEFVENYSDYLLDNSGRATLQFIRNTLSI